MGAFIAESKQPKKCKAQRWLSTLPKEDQELLNTLKDVNKKVDVKNLFEAMIAAGIEIPVALTAFRSHFKGYCTCQN